MAIFYGPWFEASDKRTLIRRRFRIALLYYTAFRLINVYVICIYGTRRIVATRTLYRMYPSFSPLPDAFEV